MRAERRTRAALLGLLWLGCGTPPAPPLEDVAPPPPGDFSAERAWSHLEALAELGSRPAGSRAAAQAREYLRDELEALGLEVGEQRIRIEPAPDVEPLEVVNLFAAIPGESLDAILLVAPYDSPSGVRGSGANDGGSGAALVLELARALQARSRPYTIWLALVEGDARAQADEPGAAGRRFAGTLALVEALAGQGRIERLRLAVYFNRVADPDLQVARDLRSNRALREEFWTAARRLGRTAAFPPDAPFESVDAGHREFPAAGIRQAVALVDTQFGPVEPEGDAEAPPDDLEHSSAESLAIAGAVSLEALVAIADRLARIDRFVESPIATVAEPEPSASEAPAGASEP